MHLLALAALISLSSPALQQDEVEALRKEVAELRLTVQQEKVKRLELEVQVRDLLLQIKALEKAVERLGGRAPEGKPRPQPKVAPEGERGGEAVKPGPRGGAQSTPQQRRAAVLAYEQAMDHLRSGELEKGVEKLTEALKGLPDEKAILFNRGWALLRLEREKEALGDFDRLIELGEEGWDVYFNRGLAYHGLGQYDKGIDDFMRCTKIEPGNEGNCVAYYNVACAHALKGNKDEAIRYLKRAVEKGFDRFEHMEEDEDLESLRGDPRFEEILGRAREI